MRSRTPPTLDGRCPRCWVMHPHCVCAGMPRLVTTTRIVVIRHVKERFKSTNTARLASLALPNLEIRSFGERGERADYSDLGAPGHWLLFPDSEPRPLAPPPATLVVVDGTWAQARQMSHRIEALHRLPRLSLPPPPPSPVPRLRAPHAPEGMATIEAIAHALGALEGPEYTAPLLDLYARYVVAVRAARGLHTPDDALPLD